MKTEMHEALSHGLRTPLTSVLGYATTLLERWEALDEQERLCFVRIVHGEALRMAQSVEHVDLQLYHEFAARTAHSERLKQVSELADAS
jgi:K+-sensing histidine kinase KdpD